MTLRVAFEKDTAAGVTVANTPDDLARLNDPGCAAVIWPRAFPHGFQFWIDAVDPKHLPNGRIVLRREAVPDAMINLCDLAHMPMSAERIHLVNDVANLADAFADLMQSSYLRLRLQVVTTNACRKFHLDALTARLICTYRGTGTQYGLSQDRADPLEIFTAPTGAAVLLRGTLWPESPRTGLLHRSPPIEGSHETRLVLVLDPIADPEDAI